MYSRWLFPSPVHARCFTTGPCPKYLSPMRSFCQSRRLITSSHGTTVSTLESDIPVKDGSDIDPSSIEKPLKRRNYMPNELLEHWSSYTQAPNSLQRKFANRFFEEHNPKLLFTAGSVHQASLTGVPEVALMGRSNVGKSTLLNALLGRRGLARVSAKPGRTQTLNAWAVGGSDRTGKSWPLTVLDMPGYGKGSRAEWGTTVQKYLAQRKELRRVFVLVNAAHGLKNSDKTMLQMLREASIPHQLVLAKADAWFDSLKSNVLPSDVSKQSMTTERLRKLLASPASYDQLQEGIFRYVDGLRADIGGDRRLRELPAVEDVLACSAQGSKLPGQAPEGRSTLGISALRWAILSAIGIGPRKLVKDESEIAFDT